jgi:hypothetical protein
MDDISDLTVEGVSAQPDDISDLTVEGATSTRQAVGAGLETAAGAAVEFSGVIPSMVAGASAGTAAAPFLGPLAPLGPVVGGIAGGAGALWAGGMARESMGLRRPEEFDPELRPAAYAGESFGGAVPVMGAPLAYARTGLKFAEGRVGTFLNRIIDTARTQPLRFVGTEASIAASAASGAGLAEAVAPGRTDVRIGAEVTMGMFNPTRLTLDASSFAAKQVRSVWETMTPAGRETAAGRLLGDLFRATGEDPAVVARVLRQQGMVGTENLTAAQKSGSMALSALQDYSRKRSSRFGMEAERKAVDAMDAIRGQITALMNTGDPAAVATAARLKDTYFRTLIQNRVDGAINDVHTAVAKISKDTPAARAELSVKARDAVGQSITEVRKAESELWSKVDGTRQVGTTNLQQTMDDLSKNLLPEVRNEKLPSLVRRFLDRVTKASPDSEVYDPDTLSFVATPGSVKGTDAKEMRQLRGELLDQARTATESGDFGQARILSDLAESVLDDMDAAFVQAGDKTYDEARSFSRELNDVFTRSFVGKVTAQGKYGNRVAPELTLRKALATGGEAATIQLDELEQATRFLKTRGFSDGEEAYTSMMDAQERFLRIAAAESIDPITGRVKPERIATFMQKNGKLLERFPEVRTDLTNAMGAEDKARRLESISKRQTDVVMQQKAFAKVLDSDPVSAASRALLSNRQERDLTQLIKVANNPEALDGMRASLFNAAILRSTDRNNVLNLDQLRGMLFTSRNPGGKSPMQIMTENKVMTPEHADAVKQFFTTAENIARSQTPGTAVEVKTDLADAALQTILRMVGSGGAGAVAKAAGSKAPSLIIHGAGAKFAEVAFTKVPKQSILNIWIDALNNPDRMAMLLEKPQTAEAQAFQGRRIHAWLVQLNLSTARNAATGEPEPERAYVPPSQQMSTRPNPRNTQ